MGFKLRSALAGRALESLAPQTKVETMRLVVVNEKPYQKNDERTTVVQCGQNSCQLVPVEG